MIDDLKTILDLLEFFPVRTLILASEKQFFTKSYVHEIVDSISYLGILTDINYIDSYQWYSKLGVLVVKGRNVESVGDFND